MDEEEGNTMNSARSTMLAAICICIASCAAPSDKAATDDLTKKARDNEFLTTMPSTTDEADTPAKRARDAEFFITIGEALREKGRYAESVIWYKKTEESYGSAKAQYNLGLCYTNGEGVAIDMAEAVKWFQKAADQGYAPAKDMLAKLGVENKK
jgi:TPR repeat protein